MKLLAKAIRLATGNRDTWINLKYVILFMMPVRLMWWKVNLRPKVSGLVSIIVPTYNRHELLREALQSVQRQTRSNWEVVVVSGGYDPDVSEIVTSFGDPRFRCKHARYTGRYGNHQRNVGILAARGEYFLFLDDDNLLEPHALEMMLQGFGSVDAEYVVCPILYGGLGMRRDRVTNELWFPEHPFRINSIDALNFMLSRRALYHCGPWQRHHYADFLLISAAERRFPGARVDGVPIGWHRPGGLTEINELGCQGNFE